MLSRSGRRVPRRVFRRAALRQDFHSDVEGGVIEKCEAAAFLIGRHDPVQCGPESSIGPPGFEHNPHDATDNASCGTNSPLCNPPYSSHSRRCHGVSFKVSNKHNHPHRSNMSPRLTTNVLAMGSMSIQSSSFICSPPVMSVFRIVSIPCSTNQILCKRSLYAHVLELRSHRLEVTKARLRASHNLYAPPPQTGPAQDPRVLEHSGASAHLGSKGHSMSMGASAYNGPVCRSRVQASPARGQVKCSSNASGGMSSAKASSRLSLLPNRIISARYCSMTARCPGSTACKT